MPAVQAFTLLREGEARRRRERDQEMFDLVSIHAISIGDFDYYLKTHEAFKARLYTPELPPEANRPAIPAEAAANDFRDLFRGAHGG
jgi:hypothetical protein